jgi:1-acyl-sn-glycerol-3-phosphate acyltransferase
VIRRVIFKLLWALLTLVIGLLAPLLLPFPRACVEVSRTWNRITLWLLRVVVGLRVRFEGEVPQGAAVFASQHQSSLETFAFWLALDNPVFILKKELFRIPIFGWFLARTGPIAIDRSAGKAAAAQVAEQGRARLAAGRRTVIFPEGTRKPYGAPPAYKSGGLWALYQLGYPVVPVALNTGKYWPKKGRIRAGEAVIRFLPPLETGLSKGAMMAQLHGRIKAAVDG